MPREILVPVDGSRKATEGLEHALSTYGEESITVLHVVNTHRMTDAVGGRDSNGDGERDSGDDGGRDSNGDGERDSGDDGERLSLPEISEERYERARAEAEEVLSAATDVAADYGVSVSTAVEVGEPWRTIVAYAEDHDVDHIIMGSHGRRDDSPVPLGSVAQAVMRRSPVLVSIVR